MIDNDWVREWKDYLGLNPDVSVWDGEELLDGLDGRHYTFELMRLASEVSCQDRSWVDENGLRRAGLFEVMAILREASIRMAVEEEG